MSPVVKPALPDANKTASGPEKQERENREKLTYVVKSPISLNLPCIPTQRPKNHDRQSFIFCASTLPPSLFIVVCSASQRQRELLLFFFPCVCQSGPFLGNTPANVGFPFRAVMDEWTGDRRMHKKIKETYWPEICNRTHTSVPNVAE